MSIKKPEEMNHYEILNLKRNFSREDLENAYHLGKATFQANSLAAYGLVPEKEKTHMLERVEEAYRTLGSSEARILYDLETFHGNSRLRAEGLVKSYDRNLVVKAVDLEIYSGEIVGLLGRNGAGKTTIFQMIVGLIKSDSGEIYLDDINISQHPTNQRAASGLTYLPQENSVFLKATVENNLKLSLELRPLSKEERVRMAHELLEELGLIPLAKQLAHSLSGGERRKLEISRALTLNPKFLLLDEPFTGIDPLTIIELQKIIMSLRDRGIGILLSDHNVRETFKVANRAYVIDEGEILIEDTPSKIATDKRAKEKFLGKRFKLGDEVLA